MGKERYSPTKDIKKCCYKKTEQQVKGEYRYPYIKVMTVYALIGGAIGGIVLDLFSIIYSFMTQTSIELFIFQHSIRWVFKSLLFIGVMGFVPAVLTAYIICHFRIYFHTLKNLILLFLIGFISTSIYLVWFTLDKKFIDALIGVVEFSCIGGISAVITAWFALPKCQ